MLGTGQKTLLGKVIAEPLRALACVIFACWISWQLTLMFLVLVPIALFVLTKIGRIMKRATRRLLERMSDIYKILQETFQGIRIVKAFTNEADERRRFRAAIEEYYHKAMLVVNLDALAGPIIELLGIAAIVAALLAGAYLVIEHKTHFFGIRMTEHPLEVESLLQLVRPVGRHRRPGPQAIQCLHAHSIGLRRRGPHFLLHRPRSRRCTPTAPGRIWSDTIPPSSSRTSAFPMRPAIRSSPAST